METARKISEHKEESTNLHVCASRTSGLAHEGFQDNGEHLDALLAEACLMFGLAAMRLGKCIPALLEPTGGRHGDNTQNQAPEFPDYDALQKLYLKTHEDNLRRSAAAVANGVSLNFEGFCSMYGLDAFERSIVILLLANYTSVELRKIANEEPFEYKSYSGELKIGSILSIICDNYSRQLASRRYFSIEASLVKNEIIVPQSRYDESTNVLNVEVILHERIVRYILGDSNVYDVSLKCINRESSTITIDQIILPEDVKSAVTRLAQNYASHAELNAHLRQFFGYGTGLVLMLHGSSGTGKTMLAHALANMLGRELLSLNVSSLYKTNLSFEDAVKHIFREARLEGSVVFFDECDDLFVEKSSESRTLLIELEKSECITILATNRVVEIDPAFDRRITMKIPFEIPEAGEREKIWRALVPDSVTIARDVDFGRLARKYIFTGGLIKNVLFMAVNCALRENEKGGVVLTGSIIEKAASEQAKSMFASDGLCTMYAPRKNIAELAVSTRSGMDFHGLAEVCTRVQDSNLGINLVIGATDIATGIDYVDALACECGLNVKLFNLTDILYALKTDVIKDPFSHEKIPLWDYAFRTYTGYKALTLFVDHENAFRSIGDAYAPMTGTGPVIIKDKLRSSGAIVVFVTNTLRDYQLAPEFHQYIELSTPASELQIRRWESHLQQSQCNDQNIVALVERHPLHMHEIDYVVRQAQILAMLKGRPGCISPDDLRAIILRMKRMASAPCLFGNKPSSQHA